MYNFETCKQTSIFKQMKATIKTTVLSTSIAASRAFQADLGKIHRMYYMYISADLNATHLTNS